MAAAVWQILGFGRNTTWLALGNIVVWVQITILSFRSWVIFKKSGNSTLKLPNKVDDYIVILWAKKFDKDAINF